MRTAKALARLSGCAGSPEPLLVAYVISTLVSGTGSNDVFLYSNLGGYFSALHLLTACTLGILSASVRSYSVHTAFVLSVPYAGKSGIISNFAGHFH